MKLSDWIPAVAAVLVLAALIVLDHVEKRRRRDGANETRTAAKLAAQVAAQEAAERHGQTQEKLAAIVKEQIRMAAKLDDIEKGLTAPRRAAPRRTGTTSLPATVSFYRASLSPPARPCLLFLHDPGSLDHVDGHPQPGRDRRAAAERIGDQRDACDRAEERRWPGSTAGDGG